VNDVYDEIIRILGDRGAIQGIGKGRRRQPSAFMATPPMRCAA
jgi:hypothetical protein